MRNIKRTKSFDYFSYIIIAIAVLMILAPLIHIPIVDEALETFGEEHPFISGFILIVLGGWILSSDIKEGYSDKGLKYRIHRITAPTLVIWGQKDGIADPVYAQEFAGRIKGVPVQVELIERAAHLPHLEQRERVVRIIREFL